jgi:hypothetical protein
MSHDRHGSLSHGPWQRRTALLRLGWGAVLVPAAVLVAGVGPSAVSQASTGGHAAARLACSASVTTRYPRDDTSVGIRITTTASARIRVAAHFRGGVRRKTAVANAAGKQTIWYRLGGATPGYKVRVDVRVAKNSRSASCSTWFTPRRRRATGHKSGAWCTATASVYYAPYDWNNVYVHSNQPYTDATASADGYSWSYETNGSGYALIYLNGPPPGVEITVTVGAATCHTSD